MTEPIRDYRDLIAWQRALQFALCVDDICERLPPSERDLASQMRRAANSVHASIAEGNGRPTTKDYLRFLGISTSSLNEVSSDLEFLHRKYGPEIGAEEGLRLALETRRPLWGLIKSLRRKQRRDKRGGYQRRDDEHPR